MRRARFIPHLNGHRSRTATLAASGQAVEFGSSPDVVQMIAPDGSSYSHISRRAGRLALMHGAVFLENRSASHGLVYRRWGFGEANDVEIPAGATGRAAQHTLGDGLWWVRNGRGRTADDVQRHPLDEDVCWLLIEVSGGAHEERTKDSGVVGSGTGPLGAAATRVELSAAQLVAIAHIFREFLGMRPRISPRTQSDAELKNTTGRDYSQRRSELRQAANTAGFPGTMVNDGMLAWLLNREHLSYGALYNVPEARQALGLPPIA